MDQMLYFVQCDFGRRGLAWVERSDCSRKATIRDIRSGELEDVICVLECNPVETICRDVTEDFLTFAREGDPLTETERERARIYDRMMEREEA
jgi:hypothetical protein